MAGDRRAEAFAAWRRFFEGLAEQSPLVLVFEDLQWADDGLLDFVDRLVDWARGRPASRRLHRPSGALDAPSRLGRRKAECRDALVAPLTDEETRACWPRSSISPSSGRTQATLLAHAGATPSTPRSTSACSSERGRRELVAPRDRAGHHRGQARRTRSGARRRSPGRRGRGKVFWLGAAGRVGGTSGTEAERPLHRLERREFVRRERRSSVAGETEYAFRHILVRDVAYGQIPRAAASRATPACGRSGSIRCGRRTEDRAEMLAHHYLAALEFARAPGREPAEPRERARVALRGRGPSARRSTRSRRRLGFYETALELWPADDSARRGPCSGTGAPCSSSDGTSAKRRSPRP